MITTTIAVAGSRRERRSARRSRVRAAADHGRRGAAQAALLDDADGQAERGDDRALGQRDGVLLGAEQHGEHGGDQRSGDRHGRLADVAGQLAADQRAEPGEGERHDAQLAR